MVNSLGSLQEVLHRTSAYADAQVKLGKPYGAKLLELQLIQSKKDIENPPQTFKAIRLSWKKKRGPRSPCFLVHIWYGDYEKTIKDQ